MTAIAGFFRLPGETPPDSRCKQAIDRLRAYGSHVCGDSCADNFAVAISPFPAPQKLPFEQPFEHDSRWIAAIDARLDNRDSLIRELELGQTNALSDESLIFSAWIRWGTHSLGRLVGDFALVVFDRSSRCLTLARDASGQRPIYYALRDGGVAFASMPSGVCSLLPGAEPNFQKLAADLVEYLDHGSDTVFSGIKRVRPGEMVTIRDGVAECLMHWNPAIEPRSQGSDAAYVDEYRDILDRSTAARMKAASRPLGILLSAGYDSCPAYPKAG
jgi:asparagine synthase (glutamine-hydrolysing)